MTEKEQKIIQELYAHGALTKHYYIHSLGRLQLTKTISKRVSVAFKIDRTNGTAQFYFIEQDKRLLIFETIEELLNYVISEQSDERKN